MKGSSRVAVATALMTTIAFLLASCGQPPQEYGVVLWGGSRLPLEPATLVRVESSNEVTETVTLEPLSEKPGESTRQFDARPGYVRRFDALESARRFANRYESFADTFAEARVSGLHVRKEAGTEGEVVYRLHRGERVKVVRRVGERVTIEGRSGHWYEVVTRSGYRGFSFGPFLRFPQNYIPVAAQRGDAGQGATSLEELFNHVWRPAYMREMVKSGRIDLRRFDPHIGLFPRSEEDRVVLDTGKSRKSFAAENPVSLGRGVYSFDDGDLLVRFRSGGEIVARYEHAGTAVRERYVRLGVDMERVIEQERERRLERYKALRNHGHRFRSEHYGVLDFRSDQKVDWRKRDNVEPHIIPTDAERLARLRFDVFLGKRLDGDYDGGFTLLFDVGDTNREVAFLYRFLDGGLQLTHIPVRTVRDDIAQNVPSSPTVMYFQAVPQQARPGAGE
jgi:hypothetical protein